MNKKKQIGIFSGSFNPIHVGHLMLANYMREFTYLDEVWFVVTPHNPLKQSDALLEDTLRMEMAKLSVQGFENIKVSDVEFRMPKPSYTYKTLQKLSSDYPEIAFTLIIGGDNWVNFHLWKNYQALLDQYNILIYPRLNEKINIDAQYQDRVRLVNAPVIEVSSTFIRQSIKEGKNVRAFLPAKVYDFIEQHGLYR